MPLPVHHLRFRLAHDGRPGLEALSGSDLDVTVVERLCLLVGAGCPPGGATCAYTRLPEGGGLAYRVSQPSVPAGEQDGAYEVLAVHVPGGAKPGGFSPVDVLADEAWPHPPAEGEALRGAWLEPASGPDLARLVRFAQAHATMLPSLLADVRELFAAKAGPQILIGDQAGPARSWIALLAASLPERYARALTYTTAASRPYLAVQQIVGLAPDAEFDYTYDELVFTYRVRGTSENRRSGRATDPWAEVAAGIWLAGRPELLRDSGIDEAEPFDAGRLAVIALRERIELDPEARLVAMQWLGLAVNTALTAQPDFDALAETAGWVAARTDEGALPAAPGMDAAVKRAYLALGRRATPASIAVLGLQLGRQALRAALADCTAVRADPLADLWVRADPAAQPALPDDLRQRLAAEYAADIEALFDPAAATSRAHIEGALVLAGSLGVDWSARAAGLAPVFARELFDPAADYAAVLGLLDRIADDGLTEAVLSRLDEAIGRGDVDQAAALAHSGPGGAWLRARRMTDATPLLELVRLSAEPAIAQLGGVQRFEALWKQSGKPDDVHRLRTLWDLSLPQQGFTALTAADVRFLVKLLPSAALSSSGIGTYAVDSLTHYAARLKTSELPDVVELGEALRKSRLQLDAAHETLIELAQELSRLHSTKRPSLPEAVERVEQLFGQVTGAGGLQGVALELIALQYYAAEGDRLTDEPARRTLTESFGGELLRRYRDLHSHPSYRKQLLDYFERGDEDYLADRFVLWFLLAASPEPAVRDTGRWLLNELIDAALFRISAKRAKNVQKQLNKRSDKRIVDSWVKNCVRHNLLEPDQQQQPPQQQSPQAQSAPQTQQQGDQTAW